VNSAINFFLNSTFDPRPLLAGCVDGGGEGQRREASDFVLHRIAQ